jgi:hypothetical protein
MVYNEQMKDLLAKIFDPRAQPLSLADVSNPKINLADRNAAGSMGLHLDELVQLLNCAIREKRLGIDEAQEYAAKAKLQENALGVYRLVGTVEGKTKIFVERRASSMGYDGSFTLDVRPFPLGDVRVTPNSGITARDVELIAQYVPNAKYLNTNNYQYVLNERTGESWFCFKYGKEGVLSSIYSPQDKATLASILVGLHQHAPDLAERMVALLELPALTPELRAGYDRIAGEENAKRQKIAALTANSVEYSNQPFDQDKTIGTLQGEYAVTEAGAPISHLGSYGADPCVIVLVRAEHFDVAGNNRSVGGAAHVDGLSDVSSLGRMFDIMPVGAPIDVTLVSGHGAPDTLLAISDFLAQRPSIRNVRADVSNRHTDAVLNVETGEVYASRPLNSGPNEATRMHLAGLKHEKKDLTLSYDGTTELYRPSAAVTRAILPPNYSR